MLIKLDKEYSINTDHIVGAIVKTYDMNYWAVLEITTTSPVDLQTDSEKENVVKLKLDNYEIAKIAHNQLMFLSQISNIMKAKSTELSNENVSVSLKEHAEQKYKEKRKE